MAKKITLPLTDEAIAELKAGDTVLIKGCLSLLNRESRYP